MTPKRSTEELTLMPVQCCNLCGSEARTPVREVIDYMGPGHRTFNLVKCRQCGLIYVDPRPPDDQLYKYYNQEYYPATRCADSAEGLIRRLYQESETALLEGLYGYPNAGGTKRRHPLPLLKAEKLLFRLIGRDTNLIPFSRGGRLLDVGCGTGETLVRFRSLGWQVAGVEPSAYGARRARETHGLDVFPGDLIGASLESESFEVVHFNHSLEHVSDPIAVLREAYRLLVPGGLLIVRLPNAQSLETHFFSSAWVPWEAPRHLYHFNPSTLKQALSLPGFELQLLRCDFAPGNFLLDLHAWRQRTGRKPVRRPALWKLLGAMVCYASGYAGRGNSLVAFARKPA